MTRGTADAVVEALARPGSAERRQLPRTRSGTPWPREPEARSRALRIIQPAAHGWACDTCTASGYGGEQLLAHARLTGHRTYTPRGLACLT